MVMKNVPTTEDMVVTAVQFTGHNVKAMRALVGWEEFDFTPDGRAEIYQDNEWHNVPVGHWIVKQPDGTFKIKSDFQMKTYYTEVKS